MIWSFVRALVSSPLYQNKLDKAELAETLLSA